jgi:glyoxylase-like metal-dependent hydrolase (beta-lactamase superfamily II)
MRNVAAVILTHFHADHVSGLRDLPAARFFASGAAVRQLSDESALGLICHGIFCELLPDNFAERVTRFDECTEAEAPLGLGSARDLFGDGSVLAVPLPGHARGHSGVVFARQSPPMLYAADAQWLKTALAPGGTGPAARIVFDDRQASEATDARILAFEARGGRVVLCHDPAPVT